MKRKLLALSVGALLVLTITACSKNNDASTSNESTYTSSQENVQGEYLFGKVKNITGNEIEVALGTIPEPNKENAPQEDNGLATTTITPATEATSDSLQLDYTGKTVTLTIPAGTDIRNGESKGTLTEIKTGGVIGFRVDNQTSLKVQGIDIIE